MLESQILSKVLEDGKLWELQRYNLDETDLPTMGEVYGYIRDYAKENQRTPDYRTVAAEFDKFEYIPESSDSYQFLCTKLKANTAKRRAFELLQHHTTKKFNELPGDKFVKWLKEETERIERVTNLAFNLGTDFASNGQERADWYKEAKESRSFH